jgi:hypothetical protein
MAMKKTLAVVVAGLACLVNPLGSVVQTQEQPVIQIPQPGVPQIMTIEGTFVRAAYNKEGYVILGYQLANRSLGDDWMLLEVGITLRERMKAQTLRRNAVSLQTPDGQTIPLPTSSEHRAANTSVLKARERMYHDSINYFPPSATRPCRIGFFADAFSPVMPFNEVELSSSRACLGRFYFPVPGGIKHGQYWLNVRFENSVVRVPFRILTEEEEKLLSKNYKDIKTQVDNAFKNSN